MQIIELIQTFYNTCVGKKFYFFIEKLLHPKLNLSKNKILLKTLTIFFSQIFVTIKQLNMATSRVKQQQDRNLASCWIRYCGCTSYLAVTHEFERKKRYVKVRRFLMDQIKFMVREEVIPPTFDQKTYNVQQTTQLPPLFIIIVLLCKLLDNYHI